MDPKDEEEGLDHSYHGGSAYGDTTGEFKPTYSKVTPAFPPLRGLSLVRPVSWRSTAVPATCFMQLCLRAFLDFRLAVHLHTVWLQGMPHASQRRR